MSGNLDVDPAVLRSAATSFEQVADGLGDVHADVPLTDAAASVPALQTAVACRTAASEVATEVVAVADNARRFSGNLQAAAGAYEMRDQTSAAALSKIDVPE